MQVLHKTRWVEMTGKLGGTIRFEEVVDGCYGPDRFGSKHNPSTLELREILPPKRGHHS